jgi:sugar phosphate isomerase/epimerase
MRLAAITDEISQDFDHALDVLQEYGATGAELRGLWGTNIADLTDEQAATAKTALQARGMTAVCLATPFYKCDLEFGAENPGEEAGRMHLAQPRGLEQQMAMLERCIALAHHFETPLIRIFAFWRKQVLTPELEARIVETLAEPVALAAKHGITLVLENEHACLIGTGAEAARIASAVNSPNLRIAWDPGNAFNAGEIPFPDGYEACKPYIAHIHVKDARMVQTEQHGIQPQWCVVGEGEVGYEAHFAALKRDGYAGWVSLETHYVPPTGTGESGKGTPEDGSRLCLAALNSLLA